LRLRGGKITLQKPKLPQHQSSLRHIRSRFTPNKTLGLDDIENAIRIRKLLFTPQVDRIGHFKRTKEQGGPDLAGSLRLGSPVDPGVRFAWKNTKSLKLEGILGVKLSANSKTDPLTTKTDLSPIAKTDLHLELGLGLKK
jgi:hypothetical protein